MWRSIFWFELRYHLRQPIFYLVTFFLGVLLFTAGTGHGPGGAFGRLHLNAPAVILELLVKGIYLGLFLMVAFVTSAATRDFERRTAELFFSKPISRFDYLTGRFAGTMAACALAYLMGVVALAVSSLMPGIDPARLGSFRLAPYTFGLGVLILPTLVALGATCFALAIWARSTMATYVAVVAFFAVSATASTAATWLEAKWLGQLLDPLGVVALGNALKYWTVTELNTTVPDIGGMLMWNRIFWLGLGGSVLALAALAFDPSRSRKRRERREDASPIHQLGKVPIRTSASRIAFSSRTVVVQFMREVRRNAASVLASLPFLGILALGIFVLLQSAGSAGNIFGLPAHPRTHLMIEAIRGEYSILLLLLVVFYSGSLIWKERSLGLDEIVDAMPVPNGVNVGAKLTALLLLIAAWLLAGILAVVGLQLSLGYTNLEPGLYARGVVLVAMYPMLMAVLACACHVVARNRFMGYGLVMLFIVSWDFLEEFGFEHHLYRFASLPPTPYSDISKYGPFLAPFAWYSLYWGFSALVLAGLLVLFWRRGKDMTWQARWGEARARFRGPIGAAMVIGTIGFVGTGGWIFYNTNVLNEYVPGTEAAMRHAEYERLYRQYRELDLPRVVAVRTEVDIFPDQRRIEIRGSYRLRNQSAAPQHDLHVSIPAQVDVRRLDMPAHDVVLEDDRHGYGIYRLRTPLAPGETLELGFDLVVERHGFVNHDTQVAIVDNGTYFTKRDVFPVIGYDTHRQLVDPDARRQQGLDPVSGLPESDDLSARRNTPRAPDADRVEFETIISTSSDQVAVTSGELQRDWVMGGRRYFHYRSQAPITHHFAYASARYAVTRSSWADVAIEVYHHPGHEENIDRMVDAAKKSLAYYSANFGPYQHRHLRIVEFPGYERDATSFPGLVAYSEALGFNARLDGEEPIDYPFYITAHEVAHQWWGQQLVGAEVKGVGMLHETLAQYSALMVMEAELGQQKLRKILAYEHDQYLRGRAGGRGVEQPLALAERQDYVYYHKGALAMRVLRNAVGEASLNQALKGYLARVAFRGPPYTTTTELLQAIGPVVPDDSSNLLKDLFEAVTQHDGRVTAATYTVRTDGTFLIRGELDLRKLQTDDAGVDQEVPIDDWINIAAFGEEDGKHGGRMLALERRRVQDSPFTFEIVVDERPARVDLDPYYEVIDRNRADNVRAVLPAESRDRHRP